MIFLSNDINAFSSVAYVLGSNAATRGGTNVRQKVF
jgi:hypothetical protein